MAGLVYKKKSKFLKISNGARVSKKCGCVGWGLVNGSCFRGVVCPWCVCLCVKRRKAEREGGSRRKEEGKGKGRGERGKEEGRRKEKEGETGSGA